MKKTNYLLIVGLVLCLGVCNMDAGQYRSSSSSSRSSYSSGSSYRSSSASPSTYSTYKSSTAGASSSSGSSWYSSKSPTTATKTYSAPSVTHYNTYSSGSTYPGSRVTTGTVNVNHYHYYDNSYRRGWGYTFGYYPYNPYAFSLWHPYSYFWLGQPVVVNGQEQILYSTNWPGAIASIVIFVLLIIFLRLSLRSDSCW
jgi:hypothetical protein